MNLPLLVQVLQRPQHVPGDVRYLSLFQSNLRFVLDRRRLALSFRRLVREVSRAPSRHVLHHDRQLARPSHQRAREIFRHVRARALRERGYLALDVRDVVLGVFEVDEFHRDGCVGANVARLVHLARGAATDLGEQDVAVVDHRRVGRARRGHRGDAGGCAGELDFGLERGGDAKSGERAAIRSSRPTSRFVRCCARGEWFSTQTWLSRRESTRLSRRESSSRSPIETSQLRRGFG